MDDTTSGYEQVIQELGKALAQAQERIAELEAHAEDVEESNRQKQHRIAELETALRKEGRDCEQSP